jgi:hypothetical protein
VFVVKPISGMAVAYVTVRIPKQDCSMLKQIFTCSTLLICAFTSLPTTASEAPPAPFPPQLEMTVPFEPTAFASDGQQRLVYEVALRNAEASALALQQLEVLDADDRSAAPVAVISMEQLATLMRPIGRRGKDAGAVTTLQSGDSALLYLMLTFDAGSKVPTHLRHHFVTASGEVSGASIATNHDVLPVLGAPLLGSSWLAETGLSNANGHRRGNVVLEGHSVISRRYAFDWIKVENGVVFSGDEKNNTSYFSYGQPVIAVADAVVVSVTDNIPQNTPKQAPAVPMTHSTIAGNNIQLDIGEGHYAWYMHLQPGSLRVKAGDKVKRGQVLGLIGNTGSSFFPHLHFEITNSKVVLGGEGLPYVFESFSVLDKEQGTTVQHQAELPLEKMLVGFGN